MANDLSIETPWLAATGSSALDATMAKLKILINSTNVTAFEGLTEAGGDYLALPVYPFAEWLAEHWWAMLHEPRKREDDEPGEDQGWRLRHDISAAGQGFILPRVTFVPVGEQVMLQATKRRPQHAGVRFLHGATATLPRNEVEASLKCFLSNTVRRLDQQNVRSTRLHEVFEQIIGTAADEEPFCRLMGTLGLSPYDENGEIEDLMLQAAGEIGERAMLDICRAATPETFKTVLETARQALAMTRNAAVIDLSVLSSAQKPPDDFIAEGWRVGIQGAKRIRAAFGISDDDPTASDTLLGRLGLSLEMGANETAQRQMHKGDDPQLAITGAVVRKDSHARVALAQKCLAQRRFTALRATYAAWTSTGATDIRLITHAITRDQQQSRAFAAEMAAPIAYIRRERHSQRATNSFAEELASNLGVDIDVVRYQMRNNGIALERTSRLA